MIRIGAVVGIPALLAASATAVADDLAALSDAGIAAFMNMFVAPTLVVAHRLEMDEWPTSERLQELLGEDQSGASYCNLSVIDSSPDSYHIRYSLTNSGDGRCSEPLEAQVMRSDSDEECFEYSVWRADASAGSVRIASNPACQGVPLEVSISLVPFLHDYLVSRAAETAPEAQEQLRQRLQELLQNPDAGNP